MKNSISHLTMLLIFFVTLSCDKQSQNNAGNTGKLEFTVNTPNLAVKSAGSEKLTEVVVSIKNESDEFVLEMKRIQLYSFNGSYISDPISLPEGNYKLTRFMILDNSGTIQYIAPLKDSEIGRAIDLPLPIALSIKTDEVSKIVPQVVKSNGYTAEQFGYSTFSFETLELNNLKLAVFIYDSINNEFDLTTAHLQINLCDSSLSDYILIAGTNSIFLKVCNTYNLTIKKKGYQATVINLTSEKLDSTAGDPLEIILQKSLTQDASSLPNPIAYYPCNGSETELTNNFTAISSNISGGPNRFDIENGAYIFKGGKDEYLNIPISLFNFKRVFTNEGALTFWFRIDNESPKNSCLFSSAQNINTSHLGPAVWLNNQDSVRLWFYHKHPEALNSFKWTLPPEEWHFFTLNWDTESIAISVDGKKIESSTNREFSSAVYMSTFLSFGDFIIDDIIEDQRFMGSIDEIRFYDKSLTQEQIKEIMHFTE